MSPVVVAEGDPPAAVACAKLAATFFQHLIRAHEVCTEPPPYPDVLQFQLLALGRTFDTLHIWLLRDKPEDILAEKGIVTAAFQSCLDECAAAADDLEKNLLDKYEGNASSDGGKKWDETVREFELKLHPHTTAVFGYFRAAIS
jgi:hypothetical protein